MAGAAEEFSFFAGVNREADGASLVCMDLRRRGAADLFSGAISALDSMAVRIENPQVSERANRNLFFAYYYSSALTIDTEELVLLTSRSTDYYVSGAFWSRDSLLWSFPGILLLNPGRARDILLVCYSRYLNNAGIHSLYLTGTVLYPGFELDELAAYLTALEAYIGRTGEIEIINDPVISRGLRILRSKISERYCADTGLYSTELDPSDDPVKYPFLTFSNVLLLKGLRFLEKCGLEKSAASVALEAAVMTHCVKEHQGKAVYVWSTDGKGNYELYDDPPGSLLLLPYYGFCSREDQVYRNTVEWIYSGDNPYFFSTPLGDFTGCEHSPYPWLLTGCNYLHIFPEERERLYLLAELPLDDGFACECLDGKTGKVLTGKAFATCAGFYGYTIASLIGAGSGGAGE